MPSPLEPLPPVTVERIELVRLHLPLATPFRTAVREVTTRHVMLVHVVSGEVEGWAECVAEETPSYSPEFADAALLVLRDHLAPLVPRDVDALVLRERMRVVRGHPMARAALELGVLDVQLRAAGMSLASWLGATRPSVEPGAAVGLHDESDALLAEVDAAIAAGAARIKLKVRPGQLVKPLRHVREHLGDGVVLQADANGSFDPLDQGHLDELAAVDDLALACIEQPFAPDDLLAHADLAQRISTPVCLDESVSSPEQLETALRLGACEVLCLKPGRVGGWVAARAMHDRCVEAGVAVWVGGMLETGIGRAANLALAALDGMSLPPDLDPRGRFAPDLGDSFLPADGRTVAVPTAPGIGTAPPWASLLGSDITVIVR